MFLTDRTALVTGAAQGIGAAIAVPLTELNRASMPQSTRPNRSRKRLAPRATLFVELVG
jgi:hypothetical protein